MCNIIYPLEIMRVNLLNFGKKFYFFIYFVIMIKILIKKFNHTSYKIDFLKIIQKNLYSLSKPPPKFGEILVIWGDFDKDFYGKLI